MYFLGYHCKFEKHSLFFLPVSSRSGMQGFQTVRLEVQDFCCLGDGFGGVAQLPLAPAEIQQQVYTHLFEHLLLLAVLLLLLLLLRLTRESPECVAVSVRRLLVAPAPIQRVAVFQQLIQQYRPIKIIFNY